MFPYVRGLLIGLFCLVMSGSLEAQGFKMNVGMANQFHRMQFRVASGRIAVTSRLSRGSTSSSSAQGNGFMERISVNHAGGIPVVDYDLTSAEATVSIDISEGNRVSILCKPTDKGQFSALEFLQDPQGGVTVTFGSGKDKQVIKGSGFWHVALKAPKRCTDDLIPIFEMMRPNWNLDQRVTELEAALYRVARSQDRDSDNHWMQLVEQLASDSFAQREEANRKLTEPGQVILPFLRQLDPATLDAEQRFRIRRIIRGFSGDDVEDVPNLAATWLLGDQQIWLALLQRAPDEDHRRVAADQLSYLLDEKIEYDPAADEATRKAQWEKLQQRIDPETANAAAAADEATTDEDSESEDADSPDESDKAKSDSPESDKAESDEKGPAPDKAAAPQDLRKESTVEPALPSE